MDYEKLHKYTIYKLQQMVNSGEITVEIARGICTDFVPESDDERIRKELLDFCKNRAEKYSNDPKYKNISAWIAWLEKQGEMSKICPRYVKDGEQKPKEHDVCDTCDEKTSCVNPCPTKLIEEQKPTDKVDQHSLPVSDNSSLPTFDESIHHHCSEEEDIAMLDSAIAFVEHSAFTTIGKGKNNVIAWLKSIRDKAQPQPQPKQEWSEEKIEKAAQEWDSKANFNPFYMIMDGNKPTDVKQDITTHKESFKAGVNWILKSLRPRSQWKPSDEQMEALDDAIAICSERDYETECRLDNLRQELKKLREE